MYVCVLCGSSMVPRQPMPTALDQQGRVEEGRPLFYSRASRHPTWRRR
jgi:hypothetical protein